MAFSPWHLDKPSGPVDPPKITEQPPSPKYWIDQAKNCWIACQEFAELLYESKQKNALVESPVVAFATYSVGWCGTFTFLPCHISLLISPAIYCYYFPNMDPDHTLHHRRKICAWDMANEFLYSMSARFFLGKYWISELKKVKDNYHVDRARYKAVGGQPQGGSPSSTSSDRGGGLKEYAAYFEKRQKEFGGQNVPSSDWDGKAIDPADMKLSEHQDYDDRTEAAITPHATPKVEPRETPDTACARTPSSTSFIAVNHPVQDKPSVTPDYAPVNDPAQSYGGHTTMPQLQTPIHNPMALPTEYSTYPGIPSGAYQNFQPNPTYLPQHSTAMHPSPEINNPGYSKAAFTFEPESGYMPQQMLNNEQVKLRMEQRSMNSGDVMQFAYVAEPQQTYMVPQYNTAWPPFSGPYNYPSQQ